MQLPKVTGSSGCGPQPWDPRAGLRPPEPDSCGYHYAGQDQQLVTRTGKGFGSTRCFGGVVLTPRAQPALVAISTGLGRRAGLRERWRRPWSGGRSAVPADFWAVATPSLGPGVFAQRQQRRPHGSSNRSIRLAPAPDGTAGPGSHQTGTRRMPGPWPRAALAADTGIEPSREWEAFGCRNSSAWASPVCILTPSQNTERGWRCPVRPGTGRHLHRCLGCGSPRLAALPGYEPTSLEQPVPVPVRP